MKLVSKSLQYRITHAISNNNLNEIKTISEKHPDAFIALLKGDELFAFRADKEDSRKYPKYLISYACMYGNKEIVKYLVDQCKERGISFPAFKNLEATPHFNAFLSGKEEIINMLLENNRINHNYRNYKGDTFLQTTLYYGYTGNILQNRINLRKNLIEKISVQDLNIQSQGTDKNVLMMSIELGDLITVEQLINKKGIDLLAQGRSGNTTLDYAIQHNSSGLADLIYEKMTADKIELPNINKTLELAIKYGNYNIVNDIVNNLIPKVILDESHLRAAQQCKFPEIKQLISTKYCTDVIKENDFAKLYKYSNAINIDTLIEEFNKIQPTDLTTKQLVGFHFAATRALEQGQDSVKCNDLLKILELKHSIDKDIRIKDNGAVGQLLNNSNPKTLSRLLDNNKNSEVKLSPNFSKDFENNVSLKIQSKLYEVSYLHDQRIGGTKSNFQDFLDSIHNFIAKIFDKGKSVTDDKFKDAAGELAEVFGKDFSRDEKGSKSFKDLITSQNDKAAHNPVIRK